MQIFIAMITWSWCQRSIFILENVKSMYEGFFCHPVDVTGFMHPRKYFLSYEYLKDLYKNVNLVSASFYQIFIFHYDSPSKTTKNVFISSKKLFLFSRYSNFCIFIFLCFSLVSHCFRGWSKKNLKAYDVISCLNKNLIIHFVSYL